MKTTLLRLPEHLCTILFAGVFAAFVAKIGARYLFGDALAWADEVSVVLFIWIVFIANGCVVPEREQIRFDLLERHAPPRLARAMVIARNLLIGGIFAAALPTVLDYTLFLWRERTPVLGWRLDRVYACFALFLLASALRCAWRVVRRA